MTDAPVTVAVPTFGRDAVLVETLRRLLDQDPPAAEVLVADQTPEHGPETEAALASWAHEGRIRWLRLPCPSIPRAMNTALREARQPLVLFVDDDIVPGPGVVAAHAAAHAESEAIWAVAGQVLQPGEEPLAEAPRCTEEGLRACLDFSFRSPRRAWVRSVMAGNLSVKRERALAIGGFDENFVGAAYRFETEFCRRIWRAGGRVLYEPAASVRHLRAPSGGTRRYGDHRRSVSPAHGVGDYYFALREGRGLEAAGYILARPLREVCTRFHLRRPWWVPVKLVGEARAFVLAVRLALSGRGPAGGGGRP